MNLSEIDNSLLSHPGYPYKKHILNIYDSFDDDLHKEASLYHDIGKLSDEFQEYIRNLKNKNTTHSFESALAYLIDNDNEITPEKFYVFLAIIKHHGDLPDVNEYMEDHLSAESSYSCMQSKLEIILHRAHISKDIDINQIPDFFDTETFVEDHELNLLDNYFKVKEIFSKLIFADKYEAIFKEAYKASNFDKTDIYIDKLLAIIKTKSNQLSSIRNNARLDILNNYEINKYKRIFIIEAPTGIGKTFTALHLALKIVNDKKKKRIITALPLTSIIDQTYEVYSHIIDSDDLLKYHHLTNTKSYNYKNEESDLSILQKNDYLASSWCFDKVIVTTFNQVFNAFYSNRNKDLTKFWVLRDSVIIFDEIQNIPRILLQDIAKTLNILSTEYNIDFILMSATIPAIKNFLNTEITCDLLDLSYFSKDFNNRYKLIVNQKIDSLEILAENICKVNNEYNSILCVLNTKKMSLKLFEMLEDRYQDDELYLLNTNFIPDHRKNIINIIKNRLEDGEKTILVSTQVVEAGVDLDFDYGFREFAPLSSIVQTAGRVNREGRKNNTKVVITALLDRSPYSKNDLIYDDVIKLLQEEIDENQMLPYLKKYFDLVIANTRPDLLLLEDMKQLKFFTVYKNFEEKYMPEIPNIVSIFIETEQGLYEKYIQEMESILLNLRDELTLKIKLSLKTELKNLYKKISYNVIDVPHKEGTKYSEFFKDGSMRFCPYNIVITDKVYSKKKGWINKTEALYF